MSAELEQELRLGLEWELWAIDKLLAGEPDRRLIEALAAEGLPPELASRKVAELRSSESFLRLRRRLGRAQMADQLVRLRRDLVGPVGVDERESIDRPTFRRDYWERSRPLHLSEAARGMKALSRWSFASFIERFGAVEVEVNTRREEASRPSETERISERVSFGALLRSITERAGNDRYIVSRNGLFSLPALAELWEDLAPLPPFLVPPKPPAGASLWVGPEGTRSPLHFDPHNVLLVQVRGAKRVRLVPPDQLALLEGLDGYYAGVDIDDPALATHPDFDPESVLSVTLREGEALFVPVGWFHEVTSLAPSMTLSLLCFPWENNFHWVRPIS